MINVNIFFNDAAEMIEEVEYISNAIARLIRGKGVTVENRQYHVVPVEFDGATVDLLAVSNGSDSRILTFATTNGGDKRFGDIYIKTASLSDCKQFIADLHNILINF